MRTWWVALCCAACGDNTVEPSTQTLFTGAVWGGNVAEADGLVYFTTFADDAGAPDHAVRDVPAFGGSAGVVVDSEPGELFGYGMAVQDGEVYWSQLGDGGGNPAVFSAPTAGGARSLLATFNTAQATYSGVAIDTDRVYAASFAEILAVPRAGGAQTTLFSGSVQWIVAHGGALYFTTNNAVMRVEPPAAPVMVASTPNLASGAFDVDDDAAYVATDAAILRVPLSGDPPTTLADGLTSPSKVLLAPNHDVVFQANTASGIGVMRLRTGATMPEIVYDGIRVNAGTMVVADGSLYVAFCCQDAGSVGGGEVVRIDL